MKPFLTPAEVEILKEGHRASRNRRYADRIKAILLLDKGYSFEEVADILMVDDSSPRRWIKQYETGGIDVLIEDNYHGRNPSLLPTQQVELDQYLQSNTYLASKEVVAHVEQKYGVSYSVSGITALLHRLGFSYKKAKKLPGKADGEKQREFIEKYEKLKSELGQEDQIYFMDGCHPLHNSEAAYGWIKKGTEKELKSNTGRKRVNINAAYSLQKQEVVAREDETINAQSTIKLLEEISLRQAVGLIYIVADNARYYRSKLVQEYVQSNSRIQLVFLPPYSPNLNVIERLWLFFKKKIVYNKYYEKFETFKKVCLDFFENLSNYKSELKTLMTDNFPILDANFSQT